MSRLSRPRPRAISHTSARCHRCLPWGLYVGRLFRIDLITILVCNAVIVAIIWGSNAQHFYAEDGLIENVQASAFALAGGGLLLIALWRRRLEQWLTLVFALACVAFLLREIDLEHWDVPAWLVAMGSGSGRVWLLGPCLLALLIVGLRRYRALWRELPVLLRSPVAVMVLIGCSCFLIGAGFESFDAVLMEELFEMNAALCILAGAVNFALNAEHLVAGVSLASPQTTGAPSKSATPSASGRHQTAS